MEKLPHRLLPQRSKSVIVKLISMGKLPQRPKSVNLAIKAIATKVESVNLATKIESVNLPQRLNTMTPLYILYDACLNNIRRSFLTNHTCDHKVP